MAGLFIRVSLNPDQQNKHSIQEFSNSWNFEFCVCLVVFRQFLFELYSWIRTLDFLDLSPQTMENVSANAMTWFFFINWSLVTFNSSNIPWCVCWGYFMDFYSVNTQLVQCDQPLSRLILGLKRVVQSHPRKISNHCMNIFHLKFHVLGMEDPVHHGGLFCCSCLVFSLFVDA